MTQRSAIKTNKGGNIMVTQRIRQALECAKEERDLGFEAEVRFSHSDGLVNKIEIDTRVSRDSCRSRNGGEYDFWLRVWPHRDGVLAQEFASCDFWQPEEEPARTESLSWHSVLNAVIQGAHELGVPIVRTQ